MSNIEKTLENEIFGSLKGFDKDGYNGIITVNYEFPCQFSAHSLGRMVLV